MLLFKLFGIKIKILLNFLAFCVIKFISSSVFIHRKGSFFSGMKYPKKVKPVKSVESAFPD